MRKLLALIYLTVSLMLLGCDAPGWSIQGRAWLLLFVALNTVHAWLILMKLIDREDKRK